MREYSFRDCYKSSCRVLISSYVGITPKAVVATAHKLARIVYHMLKYQVSFSAIPPEQEDERYRQRLLNNLQRKAQKLGARLIIETRPESV